MTEETIIKTTKYDGIEVDEYKGTISLKAKQLGHNEVWYDKWTFLSFWKNGSAVPGDKKMPMKVILGDQESSLKALKEAIKIIESIT